jgi:hypothetical protein
MIRAVFISLFLSLSVCGSLNAQTAKYYTGWSQIFNDARAVEYWYLGVRYIEIWNTSPTILQCSILDANGSWVQMPLPPNGYIYKAVHPQNAFQWRCAP